MHIFHPYHIPNNSYLVTFSDTTAGIGDSFRTHGMTDGQTNERTDG